MEKYDVLNQLGDGTFGSVAKAVSKKTGQLFAIKRMKQKYYTWEECVKLPEVDVVRRIHGHPNIVKLREVIRENNELFFVFEYMDSDLLGVIKKAKQAQKAGDATSSPAIPYPKVKSYMRQLLQALAYMHKRGYFHRDLKPENLLVKQDVSGEEVVKLADFGLVKEIRARPPFTDYVSTRWYRSPELLLQDRSYSSPVDIWAAGCLMSELITTRPLFPGTNEVDQLFKIMAVLGSPTEKIWKEGMALARKIRYTFPSVKPVGLATVLPSHVPAHAIDLMNQMLSYDPNARLTAEQCLQHPYFHVGIDDISTPSPAVMEQLASATKRLQESPQSAPGALHGGGFQNNPKDALSKRSPILNNGTADANQQPSTAVPSPSNGNGLQNKYYMLRGSVKDRGSTDASASLKPVVGLPSNGKDTSEPRQSLVAGSLGGGSVAAKRTSIEIIKDPDVKSAMKGATINNSRPHPMKKLVGGMGNGSCSTGKSQPSLSVPLKPEPNIEAGNTQSLKASQLSPREGAPESKKMDLDDLMEEFASEISALGIQTRRQVGGLSDTTAKTGGHDLGATSTQDRKLTAAIPVDPVSNLLNSSRYHKFPTDGSSTVDKLAKRRTSPPGPKGDSSLLRGNPTKTTAPTTMFGPSQKAVSPSIKSLLAKHRKERTPSCR